MSVALYMDVHVRRAVTNGLRMRGVDVITAQEDGAAMWPDDRLLNRAGELGRVLFSQDDDLLAEAELRQRAKLSPGSSTPISFPSPSASASATSNSSPRPRNRMI